MSVVYIDSVWVINTVVDYLLLLSVASLAGTPLRRLRFLLCAALGGCYAVAVFVLPWLGTAVVRCGFGAGLALLAFWRERRRGRLTALFFLLSAALAGLLLALGLMMGSPSSILSRIYYADISWGVLLLSALLFYGLLYLVFYQKARYGGGEIMEVTIRLEGRQCRLRALRDTGNTLRDPVHGQPVLVAETSVLRELWDDQTAALIESAALPEEKMAALCSHRLHFSLLPFRAVGTSGGLLLAVRSDSITVGRKRIPHALVALCDTEVGGGVYRALWGGGEQGGGRRNDQEDSRVAQETAVSSQRVG